MAGELEPAEHGEETEVIVNGHGRFEIRPTHAAAAARLHLRHQREQRIAEEEAHRQAIRRKRKLASEHIIAEEHPGIDANPALHGALSREKSAEADARRHAKERRLNNHAKPPSAAPGAGTTAPGNLKLAKRPHGEYERPEKRPSKQAKHHKLTTAAR